MSIVTLVRAQEGWVTHKVDERVSIKFPNEPQKINGGAFVSIGKDSVVYFSMSITMKLFDDLDITKADSSQIAEYFRKPESSDRVKSIITRGFPNSEIKDLKIETWNGLTHYTLSGVNSVSKARIYASVFIGANKDMTVYIQFVSVPNNASLKGKDDFFSSIALNN